MSSMMNGRASSVASDRNPEQNGRQSFRLTGAEARFELVSDFPLSPHPTRW